MTFIIQKKLHTKNLVCNFQNVIRIQLVRKMDKQFTFISCKKAIITRFDLEVKTEEFLEAKRKAGRSSLTIKTYKQTRRSIY
ncbi:hypothetical protein JOD17_002727 [Geomicrobium sediminis]|uniref:Uncharacterized protein n=1 Tax=Geomicrobium sediminis TaxID=1347788 RepID=A0ABS2PDY3_9BACL|nr:hypothetical protein [Geomicrobium sediminis]